MTNYCALDCPDPASECFRTVGLSLMFLVTLLLCLLQAVRFIRNSRRFISYQLLVLYLAILEATLAVLHWGFLPDTGFIITINCIKWLILVVIVYFFLQSAFLSFKKPHMKRALYVVFPVIILWLILVWILGLLSDADDCTDPTFLLMSGTGVVLASIFFVTGVILHRRLNKMSVSSNIKERRKLELWALIFTYFVVSLTSAGVDVFDIILHAETGNCYVFDEGSWGDSLSVLVEHTWDLLVPLWAILIVFNIEARRARGRKIDKLDLPAEEEETPAGLYDEYSYVSDGLHVASSSYMAINESTVDEVWYDHSVVDDHMIPESFDDPTVGASPA
mmetsp:Transcript_1812/g.6470  ORF Transcript_1812/g.6470 Transcript_1812/m.6470 type:complete len:334 (-) Transcript_1812:48-1049(-)